MSVKERVDREKEARRNAILQAAEDVFSVKPFDAATMDEIAQKAEFTKKTIYNYFINKVDLLLALMAREMSLLVDLFSEAYSKGKNGLERSRNIGAAYYRFFKEYPKAFGILGYRRPVPQDAAPVPSLGLMLEANKRMMQVIAQCFIDGIADKSIRSDIEPQMATVYVISATNGVLDNIRSMGNSFELMYGVDPDAFFQYALELIGDSFKS